MQHQCTLCNHVYDSDEGDPESDVPPGTPFELLLDSWRCRCGAGRDEFVEVVSETEVSLHG